MELLKLALLKLTLAILESVHIPFRGMYLLATYKRVCYQLSFILEDCFVQIDARQISMFKVIKSSLEKLRSALNKLTYGAILYKDLPQPCTPYKNLNSQESIFNIGSIHCCIVELGDAANY